MPLEIVRNDITKMKADAIVNAANSRLQMGAGVCGAIFNAAGARELQAACDGIGHCAAGEAVVTDAFALQAKYIIHTVGPVWKGGIHGEEALLQSSYEKSLELAHSLGSTSVAFPLISSGIYGYPKEQALQVAVSTIHKFLMQHEMQVYIAVFDKQSFGISNKLVHSIQEFIDEHYVDGQELKYARSRHIAEQEFQFEAEARVENESLADILGEMEETFSERLLRFIDEKEMTDVETYKKANVDRKLFSKIRNSLKYMPLKKTIVAFAIALELDIEETEELLETAGYTLSRSSKFDVIIEYFIQRKNYNIHEINEALFTFDQMLLGA